MIKTQAIQNTAFQRELRTAAKDGKVDAFESLKLKASIDALNISDKDKKVLSKMVDKIHKFTHSSFSSDGVFEPAEMQQLRSMAKEVDSDAANLFLKTFEKAVEPRKSESFLTSLFKAIGSLFSGKTTDRSSQNLTQTMSSAHFDPVQNRRFPSKTSSAQNTITSTPRLSGASSRSASSLCNGMHVCQAQGPRAEAQANCGPAAAAMIMKQLGISPPNSLTTLRKMVGAPTASNPHRGKRLAITENELMSAVKKQGAKNGKSVQAHREMLPRNPKQALATMQDRLAKGEKVVLLTGNMHTGSTGHYVVVKQINPDGSLLIDDPGRAAPGGENRHCSFGQFQKAMATRGNASMMCFK